MSKPRILVAGIGNIFFADDGFGSEVVQHLAGTDRVLPESVTIIDYGIRGMHLAYDLLAGYDALVLVDAVSRGDVPGDISVMEVGQDDLVGANFDAHGMNPVAMLASLEGLGGTLPPTYVVGCRPETLEDKIGLSPPVAGAIEQAVDVTNRIVLNLLQSSPVAAKQEV